MTRNLADMFNLNPVAGLDTAAVDVPPTEQVQQDETPGQPPVTSTAAAPDSDHLDSQQHLAEHEVGERPDEVGKEPQQAVAGAAKRPGVEGSRESARAKTRTTPRKSSASVNAAVSASPNQPKPPADVPPTGDRAASDSSAGGKQQIMVYLPDELVESFKQQARHLQVTYAQLMLLSVEQTFEDELPALFSGRAGTASRLFSTSYIPRTQHTTPKTAVNLHLRIGDLEVIDQLWRGTAGCRSRNDYLSTAARAYLSKVAQT